MEGICHFWVFPEVIKEHLHVRFHQSSSHFTKLRNQMNTSLRGSLQEPKSNSGKRSEPRPEVRMYCFRLRNCGTFMPLSGVRGVFRIAVVWTRFVAAISAISSIYFNVLFTHAAVRLAVDCE